MAICPITIYGYIENIHHACTLRFQEAVMSHRLLPIDPTQNVLFPFCRASGWVGGMQGLFQEIMWNAKYQLTETWKCNS